uniref:Uncharacterized protein n=2 Tax=Caenorhabditis tropicalis TaxID=1561998 RepID=A0A1I7TZQ6_9PELO
MMTGDKQPNEGKKAVVKRTEYPDELEPVGPGPIVVYNQSKKMSIYGPHFSCGPLELRRQRLLTKMKKEAEASMCKKMHQLEKQARAREEKRKMELWQRQQAEMMRRQQEEYMLRQMEMERLHDENRNGGMYPHNQYQGTQYDHDIPPYLDPVALSEYPTEHQFNGRFNQYNPEPTYQQYQEVPQYTSTSNYYSNS